MPKKPGTTGLTMDEREQVKTLLAMGKTYNAVATQIGRDAKTVKKCGEQMAPAIVEKKKELAEWYEEIAHRMLESISQEDIERINAYQRIVSSGIATDKMRLLRDQTTDNIAVLVASLKELQEARWGRKG